MWKLGPSLTFATNAGHRHVSSVAATHHRHKTQPGRAHGDDGRKYSVRFLLLILKLI